MGWPASGAGSCVPSSRASGCPGPRTRRRTHPRRRPPSPEPRPTTWRSSKARWPMRDRYFAVQEISLNFGGLQVLDDVSFHVDRGEIVGLIGPNGAGKTTLFDVISGFHRPSAGHIWMQGTDLADARPHRRARLGLDRTFQTARLSQNETVFDAVRTACHRR